MATCKRIEVVSEYNLTYMCARLLCTETGIEVEKVGMKFIKCSLEAFQGFIRMAWILSKISVLHRYGYTRGFCTGLGMGTGSHI